MIQCKKMEHLTLRELVDPRSQMVLTTHKWDKMANDFTKLKVLCNEKMCKDKWNGLNSNYKKFADYHVGTRHHIPFWDLTIKNNNRHHFPRQFNQKFYDVIQAF